MTTYKVITSEITGSNFIERINDNGTIDYIPTNEGNSDYQAYLKSLEEN
jgi:hypothetical protein